MKVTSVEPVLTYSPISDWVYVKVTTDADLVGWGECSGITDFLVRSGLCGVAAWGLGSEIMGYAF